MNVVTLIGDDSKEAFVEKALVQFQAWLGLGLQHFTARGDEWVEAQSIARALGFSDIRPDYFARDRIDRELIPAFVKAMEEYYEKALNFSLLQTRVSRHIVRRMHIHGVTSCVSAKKMTIVVVDNKVPWKYAVGKHLVRDTHREGDVIVYNLDDDTALLYDQFIYWRTGGGAFVRSIPWLNVGVAMLIQHEPHTARNARVRTVCTRTYIDGYLWLTRALLHEIEWSHDMIVKAFFGDAEMLERFASDIRIRFGQHVELEHLAHLFFGFTDDDHALVRQLFAGEEIVLNVTGGSTGGDMQSLGLARLFPHIVVQYPAPKVTSQEEVVLLLDEMLLNNGGDAFRECA